MEGECFLETQYLGGGKGRPKRMYVVSLDRLTELCYEYCSTRGVVLLSSGEREAADELLDFLVDAAEDCDL